MSDTTVRLLLETASKDPELLNRFRTASTPDDLRSAVTAAGFDPDHPEIAAAISATTEPSTTDLSDVSGAGAYTTEDMVPAYDSEPVDGITVFST